MADLSPPLLHFPKVGGIQQGEGQQPTGSKEQAEVILGTWDGTVPGEGEEAPVLHNVCEATEAFTPIAPTSAEACATWPISPTATGSHLGG